MARKAKTYRKISGGGFSLLIKRYLWQGPDHLLLVENGMAHEQYKRFYYKDLQALVLRRTHRRILWTLALGLFFLLFGAVAVFGERPAYFSSCVAVIFGILMGIQWLKGPGCEVFLQTAVHREKMPNLVRVCKAVKVLEQIKALVFKVQGPLSEQCIADVRSSNIRSDTDQNVAMAAGRGGSASGTGSDVAGYDPRLHLILFGLLVVAGLLRGAQLWLKSVPLAVVDIFGLAGTLVLAIVVLVRWHSWVKGSLLSHASWLSLIFSVIHGLAVYGVFIAASGNRPNLVYDQWAIMRIFFEIQMKSQPVIEAVGMGVAFISVALGLLGLFATLNYGRGRPVRSLGEI